MRACRGCGCTQERACEGGCIWVGEELCSTCLAGARMLEPEGVADPISMEIPTLTWVVMANVLGRAVAGTALEAEPEARAMMADVVAALDEMFLRNEIFDEAQLAELQRKRTADAPRVILARN